MDSSPPDEEIKPETCSRIAASIVATIIAVPASVYVGLFLMAGPLTDLITNYQQRAQNLTDPIVIGDLYEMNYVCCGGGSILFVFLVLTALFQLAIWIGFRTTKQVDQVE